MNKSHIFDQPKNIRRALRWFYCGCAVLLLLDLVYPRHATLSLESLWGFYGFFGFVACVVLVLTAKVLRKIVMRDQNYYDAD